MAPERGRIERVRRYLLESKLPEDTKDNLQTLLDAAAAAHAAQTIDEMVPALAEAISALSIHEVRQAVRTPDTIQAAIDTHVKRLHNGTTNGRTPETRKEIALFLLSKPWPWLAMCVAVFSPHIPAIIDAVKGWVR